VLIGVVGFAATVIQLRYLENARHRFYQFL
jgi:hypothetical protein